MPWYDKTPRVEWRWCGLRNNPSKLVQNASKMPWYDKTHQVKWRWFGLRNNPTKYKMPLKCPGIIICHWQNTGILDLGGIPISTKCLSKNAFSGIIKRNWAVVLVIDTDSYLVFTVNHQIPNNQIYCSWKVYGKTMGLEQWSSTI